MEPEVRKTPFYLRWAVWAIIAAAVVAAVVAGLLVSRGWSYGALREIDYRPMDSALSSTYFEMNHNVLRCGTEGAALLDRDQKTLFELSYHMSKPQAVVCADVAAIYDEGGADIIVCNERGQIGEITTEMPVIKADIAAQGAVVTLQSDGSTDWIRYYSKEGDELLAIRTSMTEPGYPMDFAISRDGMLLSVSYLSYQNGSLQSLVRFYQFGTFGQNQMDNQVAEFEMEGAVVPQVEYLDETTAVAFREDGFVIYRGDARPERVKEVHVTEEIESVFFSGRNIGMIVRADAGADMFRLRVYNADGSALCDEGISFVYDNVEFSGNQVTLYKDNQICVYDVNGNRKYEGEYDGEVRQFFALDTRQYAAADDEGIHWLRLS